MADQASPAVANAPTADAAAELAKVTASASQHYAQKKYDAAADFYSQALALQEEINGEMNPANADLLYAYGKCLFQLGVSKSDVLGGKVAGDASQNDKTGKKRKRAPQASAPGPSNTAKDDAIAEAVVEKAVESKEGVKPQDSNNKDKPFFQISGDGEDWEDDSDDAEENDEAGEEDEDDLATAYEILDVARVLFERRIADAEDDARQSKEILADVHDLQAEISLENERFHDAIHDSRASLELKRQLYSPEKGIVAEAHFKLSLALEFASVTVQAGVGDKASKEAEQSQVDQGLRDEAADQMDLAIASTKERKQKLEQAMKDGSSQATSKDVKEIGEIISEMEQRLEDLRNPAVSVNSAMGPAGAGADEDPLRGILGSILGETPASQKARIEEAAKGANDLSGLVKRKPKKEEAASATGSVDKGKRKATSGTTEEERSKRAKTEDEA